MKLPWRNWCKTMLLNFSGGDYTSVKTIKFVAYR